MTGSNSRLNVFMKKLSSLSRSFQKPEKSTLTCLLPIIIIYKSANQALYDLFEILLLNWCAGSAVYYEPFTTSRILWCISQKGSSWRIKAVNKPSILYFLYLLNQFILIILLCQPNPLWNIPFSYIIIYAIMIIAGWCDNLLPIWTYIDFKRETGCFMTMSGRRLFTGLQLCGWCRSGRQRLWRWSPTWRKLGVNRQETGYLVLGACCKSSMLLVHPALRRSI